MAEVAPYPYPEFSELAGPLEEPPADGRVRFRPVTRGWARVRARLLVLGAFVFELVFLVWLLLPSHHPEYVGDWRSVLAVVLLGSVAVIGVLQMVNVITLALATLNARDPVPMTPLAGQRVAFLTTIVPGKEPLEMVRATLEAACRMHYDGRLDVWLLDEGDDAAVRAMCTELGVRHFSRKGVDRWNQPSGGFKARTKHGNYNAWLDAHGDDYDLWVSVDTDHVPHPNMVERLVGYFRDPDVAFVVGPQVYGNYDNVVTRGAESQQYMFHSVLQRAGNRLSSAMFRRHQQRRPHLGAARHRRVGGLDHRGRRHEHRLALRAQPGDGCALEVRLHPRRARRRRGPGDLAGLLHPAAPVGLRRGPDDPASLPDVLLEAVLGRQGALHDAAGLLPVGGDQLGARRAQPHRLHAHGGGWPRGHRAGVADALRQLRGAPPGRLLLEPQAQREPPRAGGLLRRGGHGHVGDVGAGLRPGAVAGAATARAGLRRHPQGRGLR